MCKNENEKNKFKLGSFIVKCLNVLRMLPCSVQVELQWIAHFFRQSLETGNKSFFSPQYVFEWVAHFCFSAVLVRSIVDICIFSIFLSLSLSLCLLPYSLDECDQVGPCERVLNRTDADCAWKRCVRRELENMTTEKSSKKRIFIQTLIQQPNFSFFSQVHLKMVMKALRHGKTRTKQTSVSYQQAPKEEEEDRGCQKKHSTGLSSCLQRFQPFLQYIQKIT